MQYTVAAIQTGYHQSMNKDSCRIFRQIISNLSDIVQKMETRFTQLVINLFMKR